MATYSASNFIRAYASTDKAIQIQNAYGVKIFNLNICNYQKSYVTGNFLVIVAEDGMREYQLDFATNAEALNGQLAIRNAADTLKANCETTTTQTITNVGATSITYLQYKSLQAANGLSALTWYDVSDTTNLLNVGPVFRVFAKTTNDYQPQGVVLSTGALITINSKDDTIQRFEISNKKLLALNQSKLTFDGISSYLTADTKSEINAINSSYIKAENSTVLNVTNCINITAINDCNVTLENASNVTINGIAQDLTPAYLGYTLSQVDIDKNTTQGKAGKATNFINGASTMLAYSYNQLIDQEFIFNASNATVDLTLDNTIYLACGTFRVKLLNGVNVTNSIINVRDKNGTLLYTATDFHQGFWLQFSYNKVTLLFEFVRIDSGDSSTHKTHKAQPTQIGQTIFTIPFAPTDASKLEMFVNGQKVEFGHDFTFASPNIITWLNTYYTLTTTDRLEFNIF